MAGTGRANGSILMLLSNAFSPDPRVHREAKALVAAGYRVTILAWDRDVKAPRREVVDGIEIERLYVRSTHGRGASQMLFLALFWLKALVAALGRKFDFVHAHDFDTLPLGFLLVRLKRCRLVYDSHESYVDMIHSLPALLRWSITVVENFIMRRADLVITVGGILRRYLEERGARNVVVVGNWQDPEHFAHDEAALREGRKELGIGEGQKVMVFIANLGAERRVPELIEAVAQDSGTFLLLGGDGPCAAFAKAAAAKFPNVAYLGRVHPSKVPFYTALGDIVFYGFDPDNPNARFSAPNKLFESLAAGKAVLCGDFGEIGAIIRETGCGKVIGDYRPSTIASAVEEMAGASLSEMQRRARNACAARYCWQRAAATLVEQYRSLAGRPAQSPAGSVDHIEPERTPTP